MFFILERTVSVEERIKRAEEIYQRRKNKAVRVSSNTVNIGNRPSFSLFKNPHRTQVVTTYCICLIPCSGVRCNTPLQQKHYHTQKLEHNL